MPPFSHHHHRAIPSILNVRRHPSSYGKLFMLRIGRIATLEHNVCISSTVTSSRIALYSTTQSRDAASISQVDAVKARSLYRALLRECTYFPDPLAQKELKKQARQRFREYHPKTWDKPHGQAFIQERILKVIAGGRQTLHALQRANAGHKKELLGFLAVAYGRKGRRKRELVSWLTSHDLPPLDSQLMASRDGRQSGARSRTSSEGVEDIDNAPRSLSVISSENNPFVPKVGKPFEALAVSQNTTHLIKSASVRNRNPGKLQPRIPALNSWLRPMPQCRVKNMTARWYAKLLTNIMPPLPAREWLQLYDMIMETGQTTRQDARLVIRRKGQPAKVNLLEMVSLQRRLHDHNFGTLQQNRLSGRMMQRSWREIFCICPALVYRTEDNSWQVIWGQQALLDASLVEKVRSHVSRGQHEVAPRRQSRTVEQDGLSPPRRSRSISHEGNAGNTSYQW